MAQYFDRYANFRENGQIRPLPGISIPKTDSDKLAVYKKGVSRLDKISNTYYNNPYSGWLILLANPQFGGLEFNIPDMSPIIVPFPYDSAVQRYINEVKTYTLLYGQ
jgi:hypothetical protein